MKGDEISEGWLYDTAVGLNNCRSWYNKVTDPSVWDKTFEVPMASVKQTSDKPKRDPTSPPVLYNQNNESICGISALSSAFAYIYESELALKIYQRRDEYLVSQSSSILKTSKKSASMKFLMEIIFQKDFGKYMVKRIKQIVHWRDFLSNTEYFHSIILCILKSTDMSRDHIIAISQGWIFDGNLTYALALNVHNLSWCAVHGTEYGTFTGFYEQVQICLKPQHT